MMEHRLIEKLLAVLDRERNRIEATGIADTLLAASAIDFMRTYADRCHHGKEEGILFKKLEEKELRAEDQEILEKLSGDHRRARELVAELAGAVAEYSGGDPAAGVKASEALAKLAALYKEHIRLEDEVFFPHAMHYLSKEEDAHMLEEFAEFDRKMVHEHYRDVAEAAERALPPQRPGP